MKKLTYEIVIEREEDPKAGYSVYCSDLPGCFSNGGSIAEAKKRIWLRRSPCTWNHYVPWANQFQNRSLDSSLKSLPFLNSREPFSSNSRSGVIDIFETNGFVPLRQAGSHLTLYHQKRDVAVTVPIHKGHDLGHGLTLRILKDAGFTADDFLNWR